MTGGFLMAVIATVLTIVIAAPEYAEPAAGVAVPLEVGPADLTPKAAVEQAVISPQVPTTKPPHKLKGYRWPVREGGQLAAYYDWDRTGRFMVDGRRIHDGIVITWFEGAAVKAAHAGRVVAAGRDWARHIGYDGTLNEFYERLERKKRKDTLGVVVDDGNGYLSVYTELKNLRVKKGDKVKPTTIIGEMSRAEERQMMRYRLVRTDGPWLKVAKTDRKQGFPDYAREHVDPLAVLNVNAKTKPRLDKRTPPADPPRLTDY